jgi:hypothetical protein
VGYNIAGDNAVPSCSRAATQMGWMLDTIIYESYASSVVKPIIHLG